MNKYKMIIFDLDGTLLTQQFELLDDTVSAIQEIRNLGYRITVATGRSYKSAKPFLDRLEITEPMVFSNGAVYDNPETGERELISGIPLESALIVLMLLSEFKMSAKVHLFGGRLFKSDSTPWPDEGEHFETGIIMPDIKAEIREDPIKIVFYAESKEINRFEERLIGVFGNRSKVRLFRSHERYVEMTNKNVSKGGAAKMVIDRLGLRSSETIAVGDQDNDFEMIRDFGLGVVAGPGTSKLKEVMDFHIPYPEEGGIEKLRDWLTVGCPLS